MQETLQALQESLNRFEKVYGTIQGPTEFVDDMTEIVEFFESESELSESVQQLLTLPLSKVVGETGKVSERH